MVHLIGIQQNFKVWLKLSHYRSGCTFRRCDVEWRGALKNKNSILTRGPLIGPTLIIGSLSINLLALALPLVLLQIFDRIIPNASLDTLTVLFFSLLIALGMELALKVCRILLLCDASAKYETDLTVAACKKVVETDSFSFSRETSGTYFDRFAAIGQMRDHYGGQGRLLAMDMPFTVLFVGLIWYIAGWLVLVPLGCLATIFLASLLIRLMQIPVLAQRQSIDRRRNSFLLEVLNGITTIKVLAAEDQMLRRFERLQDQSSSASHAMIWVASISQTFGVFVGQGAVVAMAAFGAFLNITGTIGMAELAACMLLNGRTIQPMLKLLGLWAQRESTSAARRKLKELDELPSVTPVKRKQQDFEPRVVFDKVTLHPQGRAKPVFEHLSFRVEPGQIATIIGPDGGGKTSVMRMLLGEQEPTEGLVSIGRINPNLLSDRRGIGEIAYVDQDPVIFKGTILQNLSLFGDRARQDAAIHAAQKLGLHAEILRMPMGYETEIGPGANIVLPVGVRQKICLARCFGRRPSLILLNNPASAIDGQAREDVAKTIRSLKGQATIILVSRRLMETEDIDVEINLSSGSPVVTASASLRAWYQDAEAERETIRLRPMQRTAS